jgi:hypothetical protein
MALQDFDLAKAAGPMFGRFRHCYSKSKQDALLLTVRSHAE